MVIDDDELVRDGTRGLLKSWGCLVVTAKSEDAAMASSRRDQGDGPISSFPTITWRDGKAGFRSDRAAAPRMWRRKFRLS